MKPQDIFGIIVRSVAVWLIVWGLWNVGEAAGTAIQVVLEILKLVDSSNATDLIYYVIYGICSPILGFVVFINADSIVRYAYRDVEKQNKSGIPPKLEKN